MPSRIFSSLNEFVSLGAWSAAELNAPPQDTPFLAVEYGRNHEGVEITDVEWGMQCASSADADNFLPYVIGVLDLKLITTRSIPAQLEVPLMNPPLAPTSFKRVYLEFLDLPVTPPAGAQVVFRVKDRLETPIKIPAQTSFVFCVSAFVYAAVANTVMPYLCVRARVSQELPVAQDVIV